MILIDFEGVIKGDAQQEGHEDWINLTSQLFSSGEARANACITYQRDPRPRVRAFSAVVASPDQQSWP